MAKPENRARQHRHLHAVGNDGPDPRRALSQMRSCLGQGLQPGSRSPPREASAQARCGTAKRAENRSSSPGRTSSIQSCVPHRTKPIAFHVRQSRAPLCAGAFPDRTKECTILDLVEIGRRMALWHDLRVDESPTNYARAGVVIGAAPSPSGSLSLASRPLDPPGRPQHAYAGRADDLMIRTPRKSERGSSTPSRAAVSLMFAGEHRKPYASYSASSARFVLARRNAAATRISYQPRSSGRVAIMMVS